MLWCNTHLNQKVCLPKWLYCITSCIVFLIAYCAICSALKKAGFIDKIIPSIGAIYFLYLALCNIFMVLIGGQYVSKIKKEKNNFILTNIYKKQFNFNVSDVQSIETSKFSIIDKFLTGFAKYTPGLRLTLKNGNTFYINSDMEKIDLLREYLSGKGSEELEQS